VAADALHADDPDWHSLSPSTLELAEMIRCWPQLPEPIRLAILTLVRSYQTATADSFQSMVVSATENPTAMQPSLFIAEM